MLKKLPIISLFLVISIHSMQYDQTDYNSNSTKEEKVCEASVEQTTSISNYTFTGGRFGDLIMIRPLRIGINSPTAAKPNQIIAYHMYGSAQEGNANS